MSDNLIEITDQNFDEQVLKSPIPILVDFGLNGVAHVK